MPPPAESSRRSTPPPANSPDVARALFVGTPRRDIEATAKLPKAQIPPSEPVLPPLVESEPGLEAATVEVAVPTVSAIERAAMKPTPVVPVRASVPPAEETRRAFAPLQTPVVPLRAVTGESTPAIIDSAPAIIDGTTTEVAVPSIMSSAPPPHEPDDDSFDGSTEVEAATLDAAEAEAALTEAEAFEASELAASVAPADAEQLRLEAIAARQREQDARDREIRQRRKAERERERLAEEARQARREQEQRDEDRAALHEAGEIGPKSQPLLDLSNIDDEVDAALDGIFGPNLSYPPPPPDDEKK